jgi:diadenosine tetraphosphate (Ap4A) HIT family hydrolase
MNNGSPSCPFCHPDSVLLENDLAYVIRDSNPVNHGQLLIIPKRHVADFYSGSTF